MERRYYKYTFKMNAMHDTAGGKPHAHTFFIVLFIHSKKQDVFVEYAVIENKIQEYLEKFTNTLINDHEEFHAKNPVIENMGMVFFERLSEIISSKEYELVKLEISDNILKKFVVCSDVVVGNCGNIVKLDKRR
ncbi:MAG: 6-carboxytetrahydropterin synthase [Lachnospiraceae bacterium]|nr:6-carboxytetrahydropterin synthase [Lachnospiraceae bacterium]